MESKTGPQYLAGIASALGVFAFGASLGWSSPANLQLTKPNDHYFVLTFDQVVWVTSILNVGSAISCLLIGYLMQFGKKRAMLLLIIPLGIGWGLITWAQNYLMLLIGRFLVGVGGSFFIACPQYTSEIAVKEIRGTLGSFAQLFFMMGILFSYLIGAITTNLYLFNLICGSLPFLFGAIFAFMPESPIYFINKNKEKEAIIALKWLRGSKYDYKTEIDEIKPQALLKRETNVSIGQMIRRRATVKGLIITVGLVFFLQMSGITPVLFYTKNIFEIADVDLSTDESSIVVALINVISTLLASLIVDKTGRRVLLLISTTCMALCLFVLGLFFYIKDSHTVDINNLGWVPLASLSLYAVSFSIGLGPVPWIILSEIFSFEIKNITTSTVGVLSWTFAFLVSSTFIHLLNSIGTAFTFWMFGVLTVIGAVFVYFVVLETKGKSLAEIQLQLSGKRLSSE